MGETRVNLIIYCLGTILINETGHVNCTVTSLQPLQTEQFVQFVDKISLVTLKPLDLEVLELKVINTSPINIDDSVTIISIWFIFINNRNIFLKFNLNANHKKIIVDLFR